MPIYDKPVHELMKEMIQAFDLQASESFARQRALDWFITHYPKIKPATITAHLTCLSTNAPSRVHYKAKPGTHDVLYQIDGSHFRLFDPTNDPEPITGEEKGPKPDPERDDEFDAPQGSSEFAYEKDLRNYLSKNLSLIEPGLTLYEDEGINGIEFPAGGRYIDILAVDTNNDLVVIELKVSRGYDRVVGQLMRYMAWIKKNLADESQKVTGRIIAREISEDLKLACSLVKGVQLFEYGLSLTISRIHTTGED